MAEDNKKKEQYMKEFLCEREEEETQKRKRQREQEVLDEAAASAAPSVQRTELQQKLPFNPTNKISMEPAVRQVLPQEPPRPTREPLKTQRMIEEEKQQTMKTIPPTPGQGVPEISPRLRLDPKNFRNDRVQRDDSYYENKIFEELRQRSYITNHPT
eukprot:5922325-Amphidinium_carterae.1